jgi:hypothetical protein
MKVDINAHERTLLALYRAAPPATRKVVGGLLFYAWTRSLPHEAESVNARFKAASKSLRLGRVRASTIMAHSVPAMERAL